MYTKTECFHPKKKSFCLFVLNKYNFGMRLTFLEHNNMDTQRLNIIDKHTFLKKKKKNIREYILNIKE